MGELESACNMVKLANISRKDRLASLLVPYFPSRKKWNFWIPLYHFTGIKGRWQLLISTVKIDNTCLLFHMAQNFQAVLISWRQESHYLKKNRWILSCCFHAGWSSSVRVFLKLQTDCMLLIMHVCFWVHVYFTFSVICKSIQYNS